MLSYYSALETKDINYAPTEPVLQVFTIKIALDKPIETHRELEFVLTFKPDKTISIILDDIGVTNTI